MGAIGERVRGVKERVAQRRADRRATGGERALRRDLIGERSKRDKAERDRKMGDISGGSIGGA